MTKTQATQRIPAEIEYAEELHQLKHWDPVTPPPGWQLSPQAVEKFILGCSELGIERKFVADPGIVTRIVVALCTHRGSLLVGEPGTAKSWLSELLTAAISGDSSLIIQGGAVSSVSQLLYSWNQAILSQKGPCLEALVPSPLFRAMQQGKCVRFEELSRCPQPLQDATLSLLSDRVITIPELSGEEGVLYARHGFNVIATANSVDQGLHQMSAALKRRLSFEHIRPIRQLDDEIAVVMQQTEKLNQQAGISLTLEPTPFAMLVTIFHELRNGQTIDGRSTDRLAGAAMSTAEAVSVAHTFCLHAWYYHQGEMKLTDLLHFMLGSALKDNPEDRRRLQHYFETEVAEKSGNHWQLLHQARHLI
ncbi:AAA family ATPase [Alkalimonas sp.]|uniref:ATP-binding protein n=1 Tax=Alkalimonas sp. TaxID=1872453 RepID=UPI00263A5963|nr:AAA family ATPase [Alkalimonas sp.]MCC5826870.1 AAA family ATPase [Alkalimonas sp.]